MDQAVNALFLAVLATLAMGITALGLSFKARGEQASKFAAAEVERQNLANMERERAIRDREALAQSLEEFRTQFATERLQRIERDKEIARLIEHRQKQNDALEDLRQTQRQNIAAIAALEQKSAALEEKNAALAADYECLRKETADLRDEMERVKLERDAALTAVQKKNDELKLAQETIERMEQLLQDQTRELGDIRERLAKLETKPDTVPLDPSKVPDTDPATPPAP